ncbi:MAG: hypothetical protein QM793_10445 [Muricomes sp.]
MKRWKRVIVILAVSLFFAAYISERVKAEGESSPVNTDSSRSDEQVSEQSEDNAEFIDTAKSDAEGSGEPGEKEQEPGG